MQTEVHTQEGKSVVVKTTSWILDFNVYGKNQPQSEVNKQSDKPTCRIQNSVNKAGNENWKMCMRTEIHTQKAIGRS